MTPPTSQLHPAPRRRQRTDVKIAKKISHNEAPPDTCTLRATRPARACQQVSRHRTGSGVTRVRTGAPASSGSSLARQPTTFQALHIILVAVDSPTNKWLFWSSFVVVPSSDRFAKITPRLWEGTISSLSGGGLTTVYRRLHEGGVTIATSHLTPFDAI